MPAQLALGLDFGTESVRALLVDLTGKECGVGVAAYAHGQITETLPTNGEKLPPEFALQHPQDWLDAAAIAVRTALQRGSVAAEDVIGIGVDFTSCTLLPTLADGTPLCSLDRWKNEKYAWPKLWKHHGALAQAERITAIARQRQEPWLARYGGIVGLEWFFPKVLETLEHCPAAYVAAEVWLEAGDWFVWQLVGGAAKDLPRSTCQAGYKGLWSRESGYPSATFLKAVHSDLENVVEKKMPGRLLAPGQKAGDLTEAMAQHLGLRAAIPVSAAIIDAHAGVPGAGAADPGTLVMVMGTSSCHMINSVNGPLIPGIAGVVRDGIFPGYYGYETGQAAVGDGFEWLRKLVGGPTFEAITNEAIATPPGAEGLRCLDWFNGCRSPLMDGSLTGHFAGLRLHHSRGHLFRAAMEGSACGLRWIVGLLREGGVPVQRFVATGGLPHGNPHFIQICADALGEEILVPESRQGPALGAAILGAIAAGAFPDSRSAIAAMAGKGKTKFVRPIPDAMKMLEQVYFDYRQLAAEAVQQ